MTADLKSSRARPWSWLVAVALAAVLLYFSLRGVDWGQVWRILSHAHVGYVAAGCGCFCLALFLRALRWRVILSAAGRFNISTVFWATSAGYLGNNFLPARAGEVVRSVIVSGCSSLSNTYVLTTALAERLLDAATLVILGAVAVWSLHSTPHWIVDTSRAVALLAAVGLVVLVALPHAESRVLGILNRLPLRLKWRERISVTITQGLLGLRAFHDPRRAAGFAAFTVLVWTTDVCGIMLGTRALNMAVTPPVAMLLVAGLGLGSGLPSTPGYVGIYQFVAVTVLMPFGFGRDDALAYILMAQALSYVGISIFGFVGLAKYRALKAAQAAARQ
jgi:uncharacterized protein (TIRG00374 family)